jgi:hypothetical protein
MDIFKQASKQQLRISTTRGMLTVEQLWTLSIENLDLLAVSLQEKYESSKGKSFVRKRTIKDKEVKLEFDIVLDILNTKVEEQEASQNAAKIKAHNQKIMGMIQKKQEEDLGTKSIKDLEKMLK